MRAHAEQLGQAELGLAKQNREHWIHVAEALNQCAASMQSQQSEITRQTAIMREVVSATGEVVTLEQALNDNLQLLAGSKNFEDTVMSLAAAIHLLNGRLGGVTERSPQVGFTQSAAPSNSTDSRSQGRAA